MTARAIPVVAMTTEAPAIADGKPLAPRFWAKLPSTSHGTEGPTHIHARKPDKPKEYPLPRPPSGAATAGRWCVDDLPSPDGHPNGFYWLGARTSVDGSAGLPDSASHWAPHSTTPGAPNWRSFYPFKPSVTAHNHYLQGGGLVHHPKGVNFNPEFIEHMWLDWGRAMPQPFTWVIAAMIPVWPSSDYRHYILDAGRNPDDVGFARMRDVDCYTPRRINDGLAYRNLMAVDPHFQYIQTSANSLVRAGGSNRRPRMFVGIYNGAHSRNGYYAPGVGRRLWSGTLANTGAQQHRFYVMGRRQGFMSQHHASHIIVFEIRFFNHALTDAQLDDEYAFLSSRYQFNSYRTN